MQQLVVLEESGRPPCLRTFVRHLRNALGRDFAQTPNSNFRLARATNPRQRFETSLAATARPGDKQLPGRESDELILSGTRFTGPHHPGMSFAVLVARGQLQAPAIAFPGRCGESTEYRPTVAVVPKSGPTGSARLRFHPANLRSLREECRHVHGETRAHGYGKRESESCLVRVVASQCPMSTLQPGWASCVWGMANAPRSESRVPVR